MRADKATHVLDNAKYFDMNMAAEVDGLAHISQGNLLGCCYNEGVHVLDSLGYGKGFIPCAGRSVNDEIIKSVPVNFSNKLPYCLDFEGAPPDNSFVTVFHHIFKRHDFQLVIEAHGRNKGVFSLLGTLQSVLEVQHATDVRTMKINIHQAYLVPPVGQTQSQIRCHSAFADAPLAAHDKYFMLNFCKC